MAQKQFVHNKDESPKMFENPFLDYFSVFTDRCSRDIRSDDWLFHLPLICKVCHWRTFIRRPVCFRSCALDLFEYWFHRLFFHMEPKSDLGKRIHFMAHGVHHDYPNDSLRLVMPPAVSLMLALIIYWTLFIFTQDYGLNSALFAGFVTGYLAYDLDAFCHPLFKL